MAFIEVNKTFFLKDECPTLTAGSLNFFVKRTAQKMKFSIKDFFGKYDQIRSFLRIWSHLLKKSLTGKLHFCPVTSHLRCLMGSWTHLWKLSKVSKALQTFRSSHPEMFLEKGALKICSKFTGEHPCRSVISIKLLCKFCGIYFCDSIISEKLCRIYFSVLIVLEKNRIICLCDWLLLLLLSWFFKKLYKIFSSDLFLSVFELKMNKALD